MNILSAKAGTIFAILIAPFIICMGLGVLFIKDPLGQDAIVLNQIGGFLSFTFLIGWLYLVDKGLKRIQGGVQKSQSDKLSQAFWLYLLGFNFIASAVIIVGALTSLYDPLDIFDYIVPFIFMGVFALLYCIKVLIDRLLTLEKKDKWGFGDYIENGFLIFMYPLGIWSFQKRLNKIDQASHSG